MFDVDADVAMLAQSGGKRAAVQQPVALRGRGRQVFAVPVGVLQDATAFGGGHVSSMKAVRAAARPPGFSQDMEWPAAGMTAVGICAARMRS